MDRAVRAILLAASLLIAPSALACTGRMVCVSWDEVTQNTDNTPARIPLKYRVYRLLGESMTRLAETTLLTTVLVDEPLGLQCYVVTAVDSLGLESAPSDPACKTVRSEGPTDGRFEGPTDGSFEQQEKPR